MKSLFLLPFCALLLNTASAQTTDQKKRRDVLVAGLQTGITKSYEDAGWGGYLGDLLHVGGGIFARGYITSHLAVEVGFLNSVSEKGFANLYMIDYPKSNDIAPGNRRTSARSMESTLQAQWHFFKHDAKFRPYIGAGLGFVDRTYTFSQELIHLPTRDVLKGPPDHFRVHDIYYLFSQGFTYKLSKKIMVHENLLLQSTEANTTDFGLRLGIGYVL